MNKENGVKTGNFVGAKLGIVALSVLRKKH